MANIGEPIRRITVVPLTEPVAPTQEPPQKAPPPQREREPAHEPEKVPA